MTDQTKCRRAGCHEEVDGSESRWPYCSNLCAAIDVPTPDSFLPDPLDYADLASALADTDRPLSNEEIERLASFDEPVLPEDAEERKQAPMFDGCVNYFPLALAGVSRVSKRGNDQHNPGQPLHWARGKSMDHANCIVRHLIDYLTQDPETGEYRHAEALAWRALALLQELEEKRLGKPMSRGSR